MGNPFMLVRGAPEEEGPKARLLGAALTPEGFYSTQEAVVSLPGNSYDGAEASDGTNTVGWLDAGILAVGHYKVRGVDLFLLERQHVFPLDLLFAADTTGSAGGMAKFRNGCFCGRGADRS